MPQEFVVLKCCKCDVYQVQQQKKATKWLCKVCGHKQSVKQFYGRGFAKNCRLIVQQLNINCHINDRNNDSDIEFNILNQLRAEDESPNTNISSNDCDSNDVGYMHINEHNITGITKPELLPNKSITKDFIITRVDCDVPVMKRVKYDNSIISEIGFQTDNKVVNNKLFID